MLCSDGLSGVLDEKEIKRGLLVLNLEDSVTHLIDGAYASGAPDNVTVLVADVVNAPVNDEKKFIGAAE